MSSLARAAFPQARPSVEISAVAVLSAKCFIFISLDGNAVSHHCRMVERYAPRYVPPGWPPEVNPPGIQDWETTAAAWLLDLVPEYRQHAAVRRHPVILAFIARHVIAGAVQGARQGYRATRTELGDLVPPHAIDAALRAWRAEGERLAATACAVDLVERALRGETFNPGSYAAALDVVSEAYHNPAAVWWGLCTFLGWVVVVFQVITFRPAV